MINSKIFKAVLMTATKETKDLVLSELLSHISINYDYNDSKAGHIIEMLVDKDTVVTKDKVNLKWIEEHPERLVYTHDKFNIRNIKVDAVDNIDCVVKVSFEYIEKTNENKDDANYNNSYTNISFVNYPEMLK